jgi:phospholipid/cholesterol/gamma-HCH transport system substrate-binding protein
MARRGGGAQARVGLLVLGALVVLMAGLFMIGEQNRIFTKKNRYFITVESAGGLNEGNPVRLNGVTVGLVEKITLPEEVEKKNLTVRISIERQYEERIRADSQARIRTLGLLGDKYIEVSSGSPSAPVIPPEGTIPTAAATDVDKLIASGGDVVDNLVRISYSLNSILARIDRGEGLVGQLTSDQPGGVGDQLQSTLGVAQRVMADLEAGKGALGRVLRDDAMAERLDGAVASLQSVMRDVESGDGLAPALLRDAEMRAQFQSTLDEAQRTAAQLQRWTAEIEQREGLVDRLLTDEEMGEKVGRDLETMVADLAGFAAKLNRGEGTAAKLVNDPQIYEAVKDVLVGVNESKLLRWLIRNRQKKGIEKRYEDEVGSLRRQGIEPPPLDEGPDVHDGEDAPAGSPEPTPTPAPGAPGEAGG